MSLSRFLVDVEESGTVRVPHEPDLPGPLRPDDLAASEAALAAIDARVRPDLPGVVPPLDLPAALWGARMLYRACGHLALRATAPEVITAGLAEPCPSTPGARAIHAVDLTLHLLPDLARLARGVPADDALRVGLRALGAAWPLSSVGVADVNAASIDAVVSDAGLLARYVDRILERRDVSRLDDARVRAAVRAALGLLPAPPEVARALAVYDPPGPVDRQARSGGAA